MFFSHWGRWLRQTLNAADRRAQRAGGRCRFRPALEVLEDRVTPTTITVTGTGDTIAVDGVVTLREAITAANTNAASGDAGAGTAGLDVIRFNIPGTGVQTINLTAALPDITEAIFIDGTSQPGASPNTLADSDNAVLLIELNGTGAGMGVDGLTLALGSGGSTIRGLVINRFSGDGIHVLSDGNTIAGNFIGVDPTGMTAQSNGEDGILLEGASFNTIGGASPADRNVLSGNGLDGLHIVGTLALPATNNRVIGNFVGVNAVGTGPVTVRTAGPLAGTDAGNLLFGIEVSGGNNNIIGGTTAAERNVVGFNGAGIEVDNGGQNNVIQGNYSGVGADGVTPVGNVLHGIVLRSSGTLGAPLGPGQPGEPGVRNNLIGGTTPGAGNLVANNGTAGVAVFQNPVALSGQQNTGNAILGNSIFLNGRSDPATLLGIDLVVGPTFPTDDGLTANDTDDVDTGPNNLQNFPVLTSALLTPGGATVTGDLNSEGGKTYRIEFFANDAASQTGFGEGRTFLGFTEVSIPTGGTTASFQATLGSVVPGQFITATATELAAGPGSTPLNTSEFSAALGVSLPPASVYAVGTAGGTVGTVRVFGPGGTTLPPLTPYAGFAGEVRVAMGDVTGDGVLDVITGAGGGVPGGHVKVFDGQSGAEVRSFFAFEGFSGGVSVAAGDVDGDGRDDILVGAGPGTPGGHVKVFSGLTGAEVRSFFAFEGFVGGVSVAAGDVDRDGQADIVVGAGAGALGGHVKAFSGRDGALLLSFFAFDGFIGGVSVAAGDTDGDGFADIIVGAGAGAVGGHVKVFSGQGAVQLQSFFAFDGFNSGVSVGAVDQDSDSLADVVVGAGPGAPGGHVKVFDGITVALLDSFFSFPGLTGGVFTGGVGR